MTEFVSVIFCRRCSSRYVEVTDWSEEGKSVVRCRSCENVEELSNFTLGRTRIKPTELMEARETAAVFGRRDSKYEK